VIDARLQDLTLARAEHDRIAARRRDDGWLDDQLASSATRVLLISRGRVPVTEDRLGLRFVAPDVAGPGERFLLGEADGEVFFTQRVDEPVNGMTWAGLREVGATLGRRDAGLMVHAAALANWHDSHPRCPQCGAPTVPVFSGESRRCTVDETMHFPRTDPAVIMLVTDDADRCLLGHQASWPRGRFSTLAGFVEPGESPEQAVRREVGEEVGISVGDVFYAGSQPWPFPASLMIGFFAQATSTEIAVDGTEISDARWFSREQLRRAVADDEVVFLPGQISISRALIEHWYGGPLPGSW
jgi:NAD+ diphosphatase